MDTVWVPMTGHTWSEAATSFLGMWVAMMAIMMLPSLVPVLVHCRQSLARAAHSRAPWLIAVIAIGYFLVWTVFGIAAFPLGAAVASLAMQEPAVARVAPVAAGAVVVVAGALQFTRWKAHCLACCRHPLHGDRASPATARAAWRFGLRLGVHCGCCCGGLMTALMAVGIMDIRAMAVVTAAITAERLAPAGPRVAQAIGIIGIAAGLLWMARAAVIA